MKYDEYLAAGYPIGSGVVEGACRHLVKDRMERAGMRWHPDGAQAMLQPAADVPERGVGLVLGLSCRTWKTNGYTGSSGKLDKGRPVNATNLSRNLFLQQLFT